MSFDVAALPWLPEPPADFTARRRAMNTLDGAAFGAEAARLAAARLSTSQGVGLGREIARRLRGGGRVGDLSPMSLRLLSNATTGLLAEQLAAAAARHGVALDVAEGGFDQIEQEVFSAQAGPVDATVLALDHRGLRLDRPFLEGEAPAKAALARLRSLAEGVAARGGLPIVCTVAAPPEQLFGSLDATQPGAVAARVAQLNAGLPALAGETGAAVLDVAGLAARVGADAWFDPVAWHNAKLAFSPACDRLYADALGRVLGALRGRARKALVLDLDNTLWGGVVGDDGVHALRVGLGDPVGEAFHAVQAYALELHRRGVFLAVSSRNDDAVARAGFAAPGMTLGLEHIAVFQANWSDKASNLRAIAQALCIGVEALVLLDDNPAERAQVRAALPQVAVPELPADPALFVRCLSAAGYFEAVAVSAEDLARAADPSAQARRAEAPPPSGDLGDYLRDLRMVLTVKPFDGAGRARIAQLINKTNQFNLTGRRRTEAEVGALEGDPHVLAWQAALKDRFGDLGTVAVVIAREASHEGERALEIDTWLMSCRVLGRGVEDALFGALLSAARARGARWLTAELRPTPRNAPIADLLPKLGFAPVGPTPHGLAFRLRVADAAIPAAALQVVGPASP